MQSLLPIRMAGKNIQIRSPNRLSIAEESIEIVERKGVGHPDSLCDGIAESVSRNLCQNYLDQFGQILHHNTDEAQLVAGQSLKKFGGGKIIKPIEIIIVGRATTTYEGNSIPVMEIAKKAATDYLTKTVPNLDIKNGVELSVKFGEGSGALQNVFKSVENTPLANDTSFGVGHAPYTELENIVLQTELQLNAISIKKQPSIGPDIKVMGLRENEKIQLTVATAMVDKYVTDMEHYVELIAQITEDVHQIAQKYTDKEISVFVNSADTYADTSTIDNIYLTVTGTSAEHGDDGSVGRGNRSNGLITPNRPMSMEATSGKNPVNHIGKIYNLFSTDTANYIFNSFPENRIKDISIRLLSQISAPIDHPHVADIQVLTVDGIPLSQAEESKILEMMNLKLENIGSITERVVSGELKTF